MPSKLFMSKRAKIKAVVGHRVFRNTISLGALQAFNYLVPFIVLVHLTRVLGVETYGVVAYSMGVIQLSYVLLDFGFSLSATNKISKMRGYPQYIGRLVGAIVLIKLFLFIMLSVAISGYALTSTKYGEYKLLFLLTLLPILGQTYQPLWLFSGMERMGVVAVTGIIARLLFVLLIFTLVKTTEDYLWVPVSNGVAQISAAIAAYFIMRSLGINIIKPTMKDLRYAYGLTRGYFMSRASVAVYMNGGVVIMGALSTPAATAVYSLAEQLYRVMQSLFYPLNQSLFPFMVKERNVALLAKIAFLCVLMAALGAIAGYFFSPHLIGLLFGSEWQGASSILNVFFVAIVIHVSAVFSGYPLAAVLRKVEVANNTAVLGSIFYIISIAILIFTGNMSPRSMVGVMVATEMLVLLSRVLFLWSPVIRSK